MSPLNNPLLLGFEHLERVLEHAAKTSAEGYPPYNIEQIGGNGLRITLAVAGFGIDDLQISVAENQLLIRGRKADEDPKRVFLHRGIASRQFQRSFVLAEGLEVAAATLDNGLLHVDIARPQPEPATRTIPIAKAPARPRTQTLSAKTIDVELGDDGGAG